MFKLTGMTRVDCILLSTVFGHATRMILDLSPRREHVGKSTRMYYEARIVDSTDPNVRGLGSVKVDPSMLSMLERSRITAVSSDGYPSIIGALAKLFGVPESTWICLGHLEVLDGGLVYLPEYSPDAAYVIVVDAKLRQIDLYIPDVRQPDVVMYVTHSTVSTIPDMSYETYIPVRAPMVLFARRERVDWGRCVIARSDTAKPRIEVVCGSLIFEGSIGGRYYVRFVPEWTREQLQSMLLGYELLRYYSADELEKKYGITVRDLVAGLEYWRQYALKLENAFVELRKELKEMGLGELENRITSALREVKELRELEERVGMSILYALSLPRLAHRLEEGR